MWRTDLLSQCSWQEISSKEKIFVASEAANALSVAFRKRE